MKKALHILSDIFLVLFILLAIVMTISSINSDKNGVSRFFGYMPLNIQTGSMDPTIKKGDLIITEEVEDFYSLKVGDVISFLANEQDTVIIKTHRIKAINEKDGVTTLTTKGDANKQEDEGQVSKGNVLSKYNGTRVPVIGTVLSFLKTQLGFFIFIILPISILFIYQIYKFIITVVDERKKEIISKHKEEAKE